MLNHRYLKGPTAVPAFVQGAVQFIREQVGDKKIFCALSGGVDSAATYLLLQEAGVDVLPVFIDHGLMRVIRGREERDVIQEYFPKVRVVDIRAEFLPKIYGEGDAETKRKLFKGAYAHTIDAVIKEEGCDLLADGTILPDIEESFGVQIADLQETMSTEEEVALREAQGGRGFVKSQHNLEIEYAVEATVQPVASLTKDRVRAVLAHFEMPDDLVYRKAFPGPALAARIVGPVTAENLAFEKRVHDVVEGMVDEFYLAKHDKAMIINAAGEQEPFQAFAATLADAPTAQVTGVRDKRRTYLPPLCVETEYDLPKLAALARSVRDYGRVFFRLGANPAGTYDVVVRSVNSVDARTATVTAFPRDFLDRLRDALLAVEDTRRVYYDVTPKPPGTIEYV